MTAAEQLAENRRRDLERIAVEEAMRAHALRFVSQPSKNETVQRTIEAAVYEISEESPEPFAEADDFAQENITVLLFTSPIPSHPNTWVLDNVYNSIRTHLPNSRIIILADGVDGGEPDSYKLFKESVRQSGRDMIVFTGRQHQTLMLRYALTTPGIVETPLAMVGEHDWGLFKSFVNWRGITETLLDSSCPFKLIQLRQDAIGEWELEKNFFGELVRLHGINLLPTTNYQCPTHIARVDWYRHLVPSLSQPDFLERTELGNILTQAGAIREMAAYIPAGPMQRLFHLNGRAVRSVNQIQGLDVPRIRKSRQHPSATRL